MADEVERVEYVFEGDVRSLRDASKAAMDLLEAYSASMKRATDATNFNASQRSLKSMQTSINRLTKDVDKMQKKLQGVGDVKLPTGSAAAQAMSSTLTTLVKQFGDLDSADKITTKMLSGMKKELEGVRTTLGATTPQVDQLIASEQRFQNTLEMVRTKASNFRDSMSQMKSKLSGAFEPVSGKLRTFSALFDGIGSRVQSFKDKAETSLGRVSQLAGALASAFRRTSQDSDSADSSASKLARTHSALGSSLSKLLSSFKGETSAIKDEKNELDAKTPTVKESTSVHLKLSQALKSLGNSFSKESKRSSIFGSTIKSLTSSSGALRKAFQVLTGVQVGDWLAQGAKASIDYIENLNLFSVAMGDSVERGKAFVTQMQEIYGMDPSNLYRYAGYFYQLTDAIGMTDKASASMSLSMTKAANDIASLFNVDIGTVVNNLASGMQGMTRAVRKYGMDIRATTLQQTAAKYGLTEQVETMSEANRMALRYITMMEQANNALHQTASSTESASSEMGDFARNIETPANQLRIFKEQMSQLGRAIGNFLVVPLKTAIAYVNGFVMAVRVLLQFLAKTFKILENSVSDIDTSGADAAKDSIGGIGAAADATAKKIKDLTAPFDELNVLQEQTSSGGAGSAGMGMDDVLDPSLEKAVEDMELKLENIRMKANEVRDSILEFFGFKVDAGEIISWDPQQFENNLINKFPQWTKTIQAAFDHWSEIVEGFKAVFKSLGKVVDTIKDKVIDFFSTFINDDTVSSFIENLGNNLQNLSKWIDEHSEGIATFTLVIAGLVAAFKLFGSISKVVAPLISVLGKMSSLLGPIVTAIGGMSPVVLAVVAAVAALVAIFAIAYNKFESVREAVDTLKQHFGLMVSAIKDTVIRFWEDYLKPVYENIKKNLKELWEKHLSKLVEQIGLAVSNIIDVIMLIITALSKIIKFVVTVFGPAISAAVNTLVDIFSTVVGTIWSIISRILQILNGLIDAIVGVFTGDWKRAWQGVVNIFKGIFGGIVDIAKGIINLLIDIVNGFIGLIWGALKGLINGAGAIAEAFGKIIGKDWDLHVNWSQPKIPHLASGGVITSPTYALIGEGGRDEAVIPLDNSPQMRELVQQIADKLDKDPRTPSSSGPIQVKVYIGDREWDAFTYESARRGEKLVGTQPIVIGG